jgi:fission process protein 1
VDPLLWQSLASVAIPGLTIHLLVDLTCDLLAKVETLPFSVRRFAPTAVGLAAIPFIIHPLDNVVHFALDVSVRPLFDYAAYMLTSDDRIS